jgi:pimeloyl-ACP methyl ester carboxylesterase
MEKTARMREKAVTRRQTANSEEITMDSPFKDAPPVSSANLWADAGEYLRDAWQRGVLYTDVMRQRGNQYHEHMAQRAPNVLSMPYETVLDGRTFERPVNYGLLRILPFEDTAVDPLKRPFLVVDPRAGHGPGIGGFKPESEIGVAVRAGHPCYFATFLPEPEPTQTVEDVMRAEARFLEEIIGLHPEAEGKPVVVGNCQAGWQIMMTAAMRPELFGLIVIAGAPLSYWAGWRGMNPMRYSGGVLGGSWSTALASDLGAGKFDGAWLVSNFENMNPSNTFWSKQYNLYSHVDSEAERYLSFEKWWGGHVYLNEPEIQYIVDNLFVGNRLSTGGLVTSDGIRIDLRNIRSPIIVLCSKGDNITPPPQALGWIPDLYQDDSEVQAHGQTIVYSVHESIGHLGIFVSGSVARKEHHEFTSNIDLIDVLPPGIYQAEIVDKTPDTLNADLVEGDYILSFARRRLADVQKIVESNEEDDKRFAAVARISDINLGLYRSFVQPWLRAMMTPQAVQWMQRTHPLRLRFEALSDRNPLVKPVEQLAEKVREERQPASPNNPFILAQEAMSRAIVSGLDQYQQWRDANVERLFMGIYGSPLVQDWAGLGAKDTPPRAHPGISPEHRHFMKQRAEQLRSLMTTGGVREAAVRMLLYVSRAQGDIDERSFAIIKKMREEKDHVLTLQAFKDLIRDQALMMMLDVKAAMDALPILLSQGTAKDIRNALTDMKQVLSVAEPFRQAAVDSIHEMEAVFETAAVRAEKEESTRAGKGASGSKRGGPRPLAAPGRRAVARPGTSRPDAQLVLNAMGSATSEGQVPPARAKTKTASATDPQATAPIKRAVAKNHGMATNGAGKAASTGKATNKAVSGQTASSKPTVSGAKVSAAAGKALPARKAAAAPVKQAAPAKKAPAKRAAKTASGRKG